MASPRPKKERTSKDDGSVKVAVRFRPMNDQELYEDPRQCVNFNCKGDRGRIEVMGTHDGDGATSEFTFPSVYGMETSQKDVYDSVGRDVLKDVLQGYNGTIFVYGQTGSGKTYTMLGPNGGKLSGPRESLGIMPRIANDLFLAIEDASEDVEFSIGVSYVEIYKEKIHDLLDQNKRNLTLRENPASHSFYVQDCSRRYVSSPEQILDILHGGNAIRATAATRSNESSSRSHSVLSIEVKAVDQVKAEQRNGKLFLVDLAGSERVSKAKVEGEQFEEAKQINLSLTTLGLVINELSQGGKAHISYRNSILTKLLQDSLGGNSKTSLVVCCSPSMYNADETISSLRFGARAANVKNRPVVNTEVTFEELKILLSKAQREIEELRAGRGAGGGSSGVGNSSGGESSFRTLELESKIERQESQFEAIFQSKNEEITALRHRLEDQKEGWAQELRHSREEVALWQQEYTILQSKFNSLEEAHTSTVSQMNAFTIRLDQAHQESVALKEMTASLESQLEKKGGGGGYVDPNADFSSRVSESTEVSSLQAEIAELRNDNGALLIELQMANRTLSIRNERIESYKSGLRQNKLQIAELTDLLAKQKLKVDEQLRRAREESEDWRSQYMRLKEQMGSPGGRTVVPLKGGGKSPGQ